MKSNIKLGKSKINFDPKNDFALFEGDNALEFMSLKGYKKIMSQYTEKSTIFESIQPLGKGRMTTVKTGETIITPEKYMYIKNSQSVILYGEKNIVDPDIKNNFIMQTAKTYKRYSDPIVTNIMFVWLKDLMLFRKNFGSELDYVTKIKKK